MVERLPGQLSLPFALWTRPAIKALIKQADRACAFFEATQLAGFTHAEALEIFDAPPAGSSLMIDPLAPAAAQTRYVERFHLLSEAAGYTPVAAAFDTE